MSTAVRELGRGDGPVILSVGHAGRDYAAVRDLSRATERQLRTLEDRHADRLIDAAVGSGCRAVLFAPPRAWIDVNRELTDLDPAMVAGAAPRPLSARAKGGLGLIPRRLPASGEIWRRPLTLAELRERLRDHAAFHAAIDAALDRARARHGYAVLLDLHSMPPLTGTDIVVGDRHGRAAPPELARIVERSCRDAGLRTATNTPYAGGAIIARPGRIGVQLEVGRDLYLDRDLDGVGSGLARIQSLVADIARGIAETSPIALPIAAE